MHPGCNFRIFNLIYTSSIFLQPSIVENDDCSQLSSSLSDENIEQIVDEEMTEHKQTNKIQSKRKKTDEDVTSRRERDRIRQRLARQNENEEKRRLRLEKDRIRKKRSRQNEDGFERLRRRDKDRERRSKKRQQEKHEENDDNDDSCVDERVTMVNCNIVSNGSTLDGEQMNESTASCDPIKTEDCSDKTSQENAEPSGSSVPPEIKEAKTDKAVN